MRNNLTSAFCSLREQWQRSALSALGIMVGAIAIVLLVSIANGVKSDLTGQVEELGVNLLVVIPGRIENGMNMNLGGQSFLREEDMINVRKVPGVVNSTVWSLVGGGIKRGDKSALPILVACTPDWFQMHPSKLQAGRVMGPADDRAAVCVLGSIAKEALFGPTTAIGEKVSINKHEYTVIGVTEEKKGEQSLFSFASIQNMVYVPYRHLKELEPTAQTDRIWIQIAPDAEPKALIKELNKVLGKRLDEQQFQVLTQEDLLGLVYKLMSILTWLLTGLTSIALFVGGVGIMAVMTMSANERSREIGIRKAVGARTRDIFTQFLAEAVLLSVAGGLLGLALSYGICLLLYYYTPVKPMITPAIIALAIGVCVFVGTVFGLIPAMKAARKDPVAALRNE